MHLHVPVPLALLTVLYATAIAVALVQPGRPTLGAVVVLAGLTARWLMRRRHAAVMAPVAVPAPAPARAA
ncbi:hypothetical protein [Blastococcus sp. PRF04-17]|uniref:hypothetical protein n=1 Tax=Blastococcus sp. PRF04-17 TaxID=2933797 RepID=UPI001FF6EAB1|nr:hypothetical protein [Blastococcus sp. PRF04-17]UOY00377.1 hypothetical protein MVA48_15370 [Blastococcus sp. PRF04-17]